MSWQCIWICGKEWELKPARNVIVIHFIDKHRANFSFLPEEEVFMNIEEIVED